MPGVAATGRAATAIPGLPWLLLNACAVLCEASVRNATWVRIGAVCCSRAAASSAGCGRAWAPPGPL